MLSHWVRPQRQPVLMPLAIDSGATASGYNATAMSCATASGIFSTAIGSNSLASGSNAIAIGLADTASGPVVFQYECCYWHELQSNSNLKFLYVSRFG